ncbi:MAG: transporter substrate-binding domain-containing protein [Rhodocyclales bacterium]|nr:transporter substrate-binding domain-containing protein [Rhodocyclales bacterium]
MAAGGIPWLRICGALLGLWVAAGPLHAEPLRLNSGVGAPYFLPDKKGFLDLLVPEVFRRIGVVAEAAQYSASERAMINANNGIDDCVAMRIKGLEKDYPNLVRIDEKVIDNEFVAYASQVQFATTGFDTLRKHHVAYIIGWKAFEPVLPPGDSVTLAKDSAQLFSLLESNRTDVILFERWQGAYILRERGIKAHLLWPPLVSTEMFMYLHARHAHLAEPAALALRAMKADGSYHRIAAQTLPGFGRQ